MSGLLMERKAVISDCGQYRYTLSRLWSDERPCVFVMLNPSTADADIDDPTIRRCVGFARREGCGSIFVVNLFAFRATSPKDMRAASDPTGPDNDWVLRRTFDTALEAGSPVIAAWGAHGKFKDRDETVHKIARAAGVHLHCLGRTNDCSPRHPLYLSNDARLSAWGEPPYSVLLREKGADDAG
jgi:hypothetical protein